MSVSPVKFTKAFERLRTHIADQPAPDLKLLLLADFWLELSPHAGETAYQNYFDEYVPLLLHLICQENLTDLTIEELRRLLEVSHSLIPVGSTQSVASKLRETVTLITTQLARLYFYAGAVEKGIAACTGLGEADADIIVTDDDLCGLSEFQALKTVAGRHAGQSPALKTILQEILDDWEQEVVFQDRVNCLFVEKDTHGRSYRGRMHTLRGQVDLFGKQAVTDEITFDNQIRSPDDPFVGTAYDSLKAIRAVFRRDGLKNQSSLHYHAHLSVVNGTHTFTGDSIGLAVGLVTYTQLLKPEIKRQNRFLASDVAVTGGVDADRSITPVSEETLRLKIERAFFSPVRYVVVPDANLGTVRTHIEKLRKEYPRRHLRVISAESLSEAIENRNIVREEKVCPIEYGVKLVRKYSKTTRLQIPLLLILIYIMTCLVYPKAWVGFDYHIDHLEIVGNRFKAINSGGHLIFTSEEFDWQLNGNAYNGSKGFYGHKFHAVGDVDNDRHFELYFVPVRQGTRAGTHSAYYYSDGKLIDSLKCFEQTGYPGDSIRAGYTLQDISLITDDLGNVFLLTRADCSMPMRSQLMLWETHSCVKVSGPYLHTGGFWMTLSNLFDFDLDGDRELVLGGSNNRLDMASLLVIDPMNMDGVSPPYDDQYFIASGMSKGSQLYYYAFPETPMSAGKGIRNYVYQVNPTASRTSVLEVRVREGQGIHEAQFNSKPVTLFYSFDRLSTPTTVSFGDVDYPNLRLNCEQLGNPLRETSYELTKRLLNNIIVYSDTLKEYPAGIRKSNIRR